MRRRGEWFNLCWPRYRTVKNLLLWNVSFIDVVLISSPIGMLGLPFLTRDKEFSAKVMLLSGSFQFFLFCEVKRCGCDNFWFW